MLELAEKIIQLTDSSSGLSFKSLPPDDPQRRKPDIQPAKDILHWKSEISLEEGLVKTINYFRQLSSQNKLDSKFKIQDSRSGNLSLWNDMDLIMQLKKIL